jgi:hypothetical protein
MGAGVGPFELKGRRGKPTENKLTVEHTIHWASESEGPAGNLDRLAEIAD